MTEIRLHRLHLNCRNIREGFFSVLHCNNFSSTYIFLCSKTIQLTVAGFIDPHTNNNSEIKNEQQRSDEVASHCLVVITKYLKLYKSS